MNYILILLLGLTISGCKKEPVPDANVAAELVSETASIRPGQPFWAGLRLKMKPGWHTYWKNPGESGMATAVKWDLPRGFSAGPLQWPVPEKFGDSSGVSYGYKDEVLLTAQITPPADLKPGEEIRFSALAKWLECADVCLPGSANLQLTLPVADAAAESDRTSAEFFAMTRAKLPVPDKSWKVEARGSGGSLRIEAVPPTTMKGGVRSLTFFPEDRGVIQDAGPQAFSADGGTAVLTLAKAEGFDGRFLKGVLEIGLDNGPGSRNHAIEINAKIK